MLKLKIRIKGLTALFFLIASQAYASDMIVSENRSYSVFANDDFCGDEAMFSVIHNRTKKQAYQVDLQTSNNIKTFVNDYCAGKEINLNRSKPSKRDRKARLPFDVTELQIIKDDKVALERKKALTSIPPIDMLALRTRSYEVYVTQNFCGKEAKFAAIYYKDGPEPPTVDAETKSLVSVFADNHCPGKDISFDRSQPSAEDFSNKPEFFDPRNGPHPFDLSLTPEDIKRGYRKRIATPPTGYRFPYYLYEITEGLWLAEQTYGVCTPSYLKEPQSVRFIEGIPKDIVTGKKRTTHNISPFLIKDREEVLRRVFETECLDSLRQSVNVKFVVYQSNVEDKIELKVVITAKENPKWDLSKAQRVVKDSIESRSLIYKGNTGYSEVYPILKDTYFELGNFIGASEMQIFCNAPVFELENITYIDWDSDLHVNYEKQSAEVLDKVLTSSGLLDQHVTDYVIGSLAKGCNPEEIGEVTLTFTFNEVKADILRSGLSGRVEMHEKHPQITWNSNTSLDKLYDHELNQVRLDIAEHRRNEQLRLREESLLAAKAAEEMRRRYNNCNLRDAKKLVIYCSDYYCNKKDPTGLPPICARKTDYTFDDLGALFSSRVGPSLWYNVKNRVCYDREHDALVSACSSLGDQNLESTR